MVWCFLWGRGFKATSSWLTSGLPPLVWESYRHCYIKDFLNISFKFTIWVFESKTVFNICFIFLFIFWLFIHQFRHLEPPKNGDVSLAELCTPSFIKGRFLLWLVSSSFHWCLTENDVLISCFSSCGAHFSVVVTLKGDCSKHYFKSLSVFSL